MNTPADSEPSQPLAVPLSDLLGPAVRAAYDAWYAAATFETMGHEWTWAAWQAATEAAACAVQQVPTHRWVDGSDQWGHPCPVKVVATRANYVAAIRGA